MQFKKIKYFFLELIFKKRYCFWKSVIMKKSFVIDFITRRFKYLFRQEKRAVIIAPFRTIWKESIYFLWKYSFQNWNNFENFNYFIRKNTIFNFFFNVIILLSFSDFFLYLTIKNFYTNVTYPCIRMRVFIVSFESYFLLLLRQEAWNR